MNRKKMGKNGAKQQGHHAAHDLISLNNKLSANATIVIKCVNISFFFNSIPLRPLFAVVFKVVVNTVVETVI